MGHAGTSAVNDDGYREILGIVEGAKEDKAGWSSFLKHLKERGLSGVELVISDACLGLVESLAEVYPEARWQRCVVHWYRNAFSHVPSTKVREVALMLKAIHAQECRTAARAKADEVIAKLKAMRLAKVAGCRGDGRRDPGLLRLPRRALAPDQNQQSLGAHHARDPQTNPRGRCLPRWTRPPGRSFHEPLNLAAARLRHIAGTKWSAKRYMNMKLLKQHKMST